ncbi:hypothetical protein Lupro_09315 [Lutibacter profundi]|uniref:Uncharacterized protein n=1 Tax=Lutibacter profundi TaxID=1622118 RepID=A0A0X8G7I2_9FLAO|nr:hypothetical protein [Lutibacter profundi]AMC11451.1 hypothetical protein Lupro_09315 [Lutibacter profundi]
MKKTLKYLIAIALTAFALLTLFLSSSIIFDWFGIRAKEGNYVLMVVWANFISSILYLFAAYGFITIKNWTVKLLGISLTLLVVAAIGFIIHINTGGLYETKTIGALIFRFTITLVFTFFAYLTTIKWNK